MRLVKRNVALPDAVILTLTTGIAGLPAKWATKIFPAFVIRGSKWGRARLRRSISASMRSRMALAAWGLALAWCCLGALSATRGATLTLSTVGFLSLWAVPRAVPAAPGRFYVSRIIPSSVPFVNLSKHLYNELNKPDKGGELDSRHRETDLGRVLFEARERKGWSQERLSRESRVSRVTISKWETGQIDAPKMGTIRKLAAALDLPVGALLDPLGVALAPH